MSSPLTRDDVRRIAALARLELTAAEEALFTRQLADILAYARAVQEIDTRDVPPAATAATIPPALRDDVPQPSLDRADVLNMAPDADRHAGLFKVPKVL